MTKRSKRLTRYRNEIKGNGPNKASSGPDQGTEPFKPRLIQRPPRNITIVLGRSAYVCQKGFLMKSSRFFQSVIGTTVFDPADREELSFDETIPYEEFGLYLRTLWDFHFADHQNFSFGPEYASKAFGFRFLRAALALWRIADRLEDPILRNVAEMAIRGPIDAGYSRGEFLDGEFLHPDESVANIVLEDNLNTLDTCVTYCLDKELPSWLIQKLVDMASSKPYSSILLRHSDRFGSIFRAAIGLKITKVRPPEFLPHSTRHT